MESVAETVMVMAQQFWGQEETTHSPGHCMHTPVLTALCTLSSLTLQSMTQVRSALSVVREAVVMICAAARTMLHRPATLGFCSQRLSPIRKCFVDLNIKAQG